MNSKNPDLPSNPNAQSVVVKVEHRDVRSDRILSSVLLLGDTDARSWKTIRKHNGDADLSCSILLASHHGSIGFFDDPADERYYYLDHLTAMSPAVTIISVGDNCHGHPDRQALKFYERHSTGSNKGNRLFRTDHHGQLKDEGGWSLTKSK